tara:strand:+ start:648 stop:1277 length:630 start_codon:yes stop_codon:yes gene_type:complete
MKHIRLILWGLVAVALIGFIFTSLPQKTDNSANSQAVFKPMAGFEKGADFALTTHTGDVFDTRKDIGQNGYALIFFGFAHCPVICPTELQKFSDVMDMLPEHIANRVTPLFITIDPDRDTVETMQEYVSMFHPSIIGLTGNPQEVHKVLNNWKVYYSKVEDPSLNGYTMDHSTYSYLVDTNMNMLALFRMQATADDIAERIVQIAASNN